MKNPRFTTTDGDLAAHLAAVNGRDVDVQFSARKNRVTYSIDWDARLDDDLDCFRAGRAMVPSPMILEVSAEIRRKARAIKAARAAGGGA